MSEVDFQKALREILEARRVQSADPDEVLRYRQDELTERDREHLLEHAAVSPATARALLDARTFPAVEPAEEGDRVKTEDLDLQWRRLRNRLQDKKKAESISEVLNSSWFGRVGPFLTSLRFARVTAAISLSALIVSWTVFLQSRQSKESKPRINLPIIELIPESLASERGLAREVDLPDFSTGMLLVFTLDVRVPAGEYEVKIQDSEANEVWSSFDLRHTREGLLTLVLPRGFLPPGKYRFTIWSIDGGQRKRQAAYDLKLR